jgi:hypothetical protein
VSAYDISETLKKEGVPRSPIAVAQVLKQEGFAKLPRRKDEERPQGIKPTASDQADVRSLSLEPRHVLADAEQRKQEDRQKRKHAGDQHAECMAHPVALCRW